MAARTIVILGAGTGGLVAARRLRRMLDGDHRIVLVDRTPVYSFAPSFTFVMLGQRDGGRISRDLRKLSKKGIEFVAAEVLRIDPGEKRVHLADRELTYDYLVIALGAEYSADEVPGLRRAWTYYHLEGAEGLREKLPEFRSGRIAVVVSGLPYKCPAAPYEGALMLDHYFRRRGLRDQVEIRVYTPEPQPLPVAGKAAGEMVMELLSARDVGFTPGVTPKAVNHKTGKLRMHDGSEEPFDLLIATPIHRVPQALRESGMAGEGWVQVDPETLATEFKDVYAIGDVTGITLPNGMSLPKAGVFAHGEAEVVARNIAAEVTGSDPIWAFGGQGACFLETGGGKGAYVSGNFFAEPAPEVSLRGPNRFWHWARMGFERTWLWRWF